MVAGADIVRAAEKELGDPYDWGSQGPNRFDCSGLVEYVYKQFGIRTPRTTSQMMASTSLQPITRADLQPGDLVFSDWGRGPSSHVGIYAGNNKIIEAGDSGVAYTTLGPNYSKRLTAFRRVPGIDGYAPGTYPATGAGGSGGTAGSGGGNVIVDIATAPARLAQAWLAGPKNMTEALTNVGTAMQGMASGAIEAGKLAQTVTRAFLPSNLLRGVYLFMGIVFVLIGIWFLAREIKS